MKQISQTNKDCQRFWHGLILGLILGACTAGCGFFKLRTSYRESVNYAVSLCAGQYQLLEVELIPREHLDGLAKQFGATMPGSVENHMDLLQANPDWIRGSIASAVYEALLKEQEGIPEEHPAKACYGRTLKLARHMIDKYSPENAPRIHLATRGQ